MKEDVKVFVLIEDGGYDSGYSKVFGVFSSKEKANECYDKISKNRTNIDSMFDFDILEFILDKEYLEEN